MDAHGGDVYSRRIRWDFSANVNPLGTPEGVKEAVRRSAEDCCRYPDPRCRRLKKALGAFHQIPEDRILCGNGAADLIFQLALAMRPKQALLLAPTFSEYEKALEAAGCRQELYCLERERDFRPDVRVLEEKIRTMGKEGKKPEILFFCNPNNPTGTAVPKQELEELAEFLEKQKICFALDECFVDFLDHPEAFSLLQETDRFPHMVIFKAFTKLYGMAGLRLGYCVTANQALLKKMEEVRQPWSVSGTAQEAGLAALGESEYREKTKDMIRRGRKQLFEGLSDLGFQVIPPAANYVFFRDVRPEVPEGSLYEECLKRELLIRSCGNYYGLDGRDYRVCVKGEEENQVLLSLLKACRDAGA